MSDCDCTAGSSKESKRTLPFLLVFLFVTFLLKVPALAPDGQVPTIVFIEVPRLPV